MRARTIRNTVVFALALCAASARSATVSHVPVNSGRYRGDIRIETNSDAQPRGNERVNADVTRVQVETDYGLMGGVVDVSNPSGEWSVSAEASVQLTDRPPLPEYLAPFGYQSTVELSLSRRYRVTISDEGRDAGFGDVSGVSFKPLFARRGAQNFTSLERVGLRAPASIILSFGNGSFVNSASGGFSGESTISGGTTFIPLGVELTQLLGVSVRAEAEAQAFPYQKGISNSLEAAFLGIIELKSSDGRPMGMGHLTLQDLDTGETFTWTTVPEPNIGIAAVLIVMGLCQRRRWARRVSPEGPVLQYRRAFRYIPSP